MVHQGKALIRILLHLIFSIEVAQAKGASHMETNSQSNQKQESCGPNGSKDRILRSTSRSSSSREKSMEKSCSSAHRGKRTLWGRTSVSENVIGIGLHINAGRIILQFYGNTWYTGKKRPVNRGDWMLQWWWVSGLGTFGLWACPIYWKNCKHISFESATTFSSFSFSIRYLLLVILVFV
jgi:hypothetical protein